MAKKKTHTKEDGKVILQDWRGHCVSVPEGSSVEARLRSAGYIGLGETRGSPQTTPQQVEPPTDKDT